MLSFLVLFNWKAICENCYKGLHKSTKNIQTFAKSKLFEHL